MRYRSTPSSDIASSSSVVIGRVAVAVDMAFSFEILPTRPIITKASPADTPCPSRYDDGMNDPSSDEAKESTGNASRPLASLTVAAFESRRADEMARLIERHGGTPRVSPSMREKPVEDHAAAVNFANAIMTGEFDAVLFMTGVGFRHFIAAVERRVPLDRLLSALADMTTIARGPKPAAAMKERGLKPTIRVPEPNTWREILATLDAEYPLANRIIGVQEYGAPNLSLVAGLEARGASVNTLKVYDWDLPEDPKPLIENCRALVAGEIDLALFTSAQQLENLLTVARREGQYQEALAALRRVVVCSIGPTTSEKLAAREIPVDLEPDHPKMGSLVAAVAQRGPALVARKRQFIRVLASPQPPAGPNAPPPPWHDSPFMRACRREPTDVTPVWLMRQAGRYMAEYRALRSKVSFLELCKRPDLCSEIMVTAVRKLGVDAAIIFSDLLPILEPMGFDLEFAQGEGPVIHNPLREADDVDRVIELESVDALSFVMETVRQTRLDLPDDLPLIGFAGAPFTLASYAIEGGASRNYLNTKTLMYRDAGAFHALMGRFSRAITRYLSAQIAAGAQAVQIFDSWVGCLSPADYREHVLPHMKEIVRGVAPGAPVITFATGNPQLLPLLAESGAAVVGVDWRIDLAEAWRIIGPGHAVQGNLDPAALLADHETIRAMTKSILDSVRGQPGHIFNLGHGVLQQTPVENAVALVEMAHEMSAGP